MQVKNQGTSQNHFKVTKKGGKKFKRINKGKLRTKGKSHQRDHFSTWKILQAFTWSTHQFNTITW